MKDLTQGSITRHILTMSFVMLIGMAGQTAYFLVDLYFVAHLGAQAIAGVGAAGNVSFVVFALTQILGVGTLALIAHAAGRKDQPDANLVFNQSLVLSGICAAITLVTGYLLTNVYMHTVGADPEMQASGITYLRWYLPGLALQFALVSMGSALRGTGIVKPGTVVQLLTVVLNIVLAPVLIAGWGTGVPMGVAGAGLATTIAVGAGVVMLTVYFLRLEHYVGFRRDQLKPRFAYWKRILNIGLPAGGEFFVMFLTMVMMYWLIRDFGSSAQAGYGIGSRIMQAIFLPAMAIAFSASPIAGQNFGARRADRVRETFHKAAGIEIAIMVAVTLLCHIAPRSMIAAFSTDPEVISVGTMFLRIISWNFVASGFMFTCSGMFQAIGNTWPAMWSSVLRLAIFGIPAVWMSMRPGFDIEQLFHWSVITVFLQAGLTYWLLRVQLDKRLVFSQAPARAAA
ncbi:MAG: MATE family efflux transporter [Gammaproteobacteria bacterium]